VDQQHAGGGFLGIEDERAVPVAVPPPGVGETAAREAVDIALRFFLDLVVDALIQFRVQGVLDGQVVGESIT
jgi:hypothetical protein